jgi:hypothetical protein
MIIPNSPTLFLSNLFADISQKLSTPASYRAFETYDRAFVPTPTKVNPPKTGRTEGYPRILWVSPLRVKMGNTDTDRNHKYSVSLYWVADQLFFIDRATQQANMNAERTAFAFEAMNEFLQLLRSYKSSNINTGAPGKIVQILNSEEREVESGEVGKGATFTTAELRLEIKIAPICYPAKLLLADPIAPILQPTPPVTPITVGTLPQGEDLLDFRQNI